jgi:hypothetical protein
MNLALGKPADKLLRHLYQADRLPALEFLICRHHRSRRRRVNRERMPGNSLLDEGQPGMLNQQ